MHGWLAEVHGWLAESRRLAGAAGSEGDLLHATVGFGQLAWVRGDHAEAAEIMEAASRVLAEIDPSLSPPRSVRQSGNRPWQRTVDDVAGCLVEALRNEPPADKVAILVPAARLHELSRAIRAEVPDLAVGSLPDLRRRVAMLTVRQAKGLEFDSVLVVDPQRIVDESPRGLSDLYVALTRATQRLGILGNLASCVGTTPGK